MRVAGIVIILVLAAACAGAPSREAARPVPASSLGLAPGELTADPAPPAFHRNESEPGEEPALPRAYPGAPPVVPHGVDAFLPITRTENYCLECHMVEEKIEGETTPIPPSHYVDLRNEPGHEGNSVTGARWNCTACHASRTDAEPLVRNSFTARDPDK